MSKGVPLMDRFKGIDMFGNPVKLTYKKAYAYTSHFGAGGTLIMYVMLLAYAADGLVKVINNEVKSIAHIDDKLDMNEYQGFSPGNASYFKEPSFNLAFGMGQELDPSIGSWKLEYKEKYGRNNPK